MFKYLNCNFWRMLTGFLAILAMAVGLLFYFGSIGNLKEPSSETNFAGTGEAE
ncbi:MAG: hypothetical protein WCX70_01785 [Candidatus Paceibacterota bacterium]|jgi:hypothetical protein